MKNESELPIQLLLEQHSVRYHIFREHKTKVMTRMMHCSEDSDALGRGSGWHTQQLLSPCSEVSHMAMPGSKGGKCRPLACHITSPNKIWVLVLWAKREENGY